MPLPDRIARRLTVPIIAAPMLRVSGPDLVIAACNAGAIGAFPTANTRSIEELNAWLSRIEAATNADSAPYCPNLIIRQPRLADDLACLCRHRVELVITSVGSPAGVVGPLHDAGALVLADVATIEHAEKALRVGVDGLVLLTAGAGGQTGWANPFAFVRAVRKMYDGPLVLAGGIGDGWALWAAQCLGCDLGYMGTHFIATVESLAADAYKAMLVASNLDDVMLSRAFSGLPASILRPSIVASGLDPATLDENITMEAARETYGAGSAGPRRWADVWSAGHSVSSVENLCSVAELIGRMRREHREARLHSCGDGGG